MKKFFAEFKKFISRGNVMDMAVGTIVGAAFTAIVTALSNGILKPIINMIIYYCCGGDTSALEKMYTVLVRVETTDESGAKVLDLTNSIYIDWGAFISAIINFLLVAFVLFLIVRAFNNVKEASEKANNTYLRAVAKQEKGLKLTKKEAKAIAAHDEAEAKAKAEKEEADRLAAEEANKLSKTDALLTEIKELLAKK
jgi:large conductance mechanosensitive channel